jgi:hypothetical protein
VVVAPHASQDANGSQSGTQHQQLANGQAGLNQGGFDGRGGSQGTYAESFGDEAPSRSSRVATARGVSQPRYAASREATSRLDVMA